MCPLCFLLGSKNTSSAPFPAAGVLHQQPCLALLKERQHCTCVSLPWHPLTPFTIYLDIWPRNQQACFSHPPQQSSIMSISSQCVPRRQTSRSSQRHFKLYWLWPDVPRLGNYVYWMFTYQLLSKSGFSSSRVWLWELDHKEGWVPKTWWFFPIVVLEKTLESPSDRKEGKLVNSKGNQPWIFTGRTEAKAEVPILWPPDAKSWLGKDLDTRKDWGQKEKGATHEMVQWYHRHSGPEFEQTPEDSEGQGSLACSSQRGYKESGMAWQLNGNKLLKSQYRLPWG